MKTVYKKTQYSILVLIFMLPIIAFLGYAYTYQIGSKPISLWLAFAVLLILLLALALFYKITITVDNTKIVATFGIGLLKRSIPISEIDFKTLEKVNFSALVGIGLRLTSKGWLWNVKVGDAIHFKTKQGNTFLVGTDDYEQITTFLKTK